MAKAKKSAETTGRRKLTEMGVKEGMKELLSKSLKASKGTQGANNAFANAVYLDFKDPKTGTACLPIEWLFGTRGLICGRVLNMYGPEAVGKTSLTCMFLGMFQKTSDCYSIFGDTEETPMPPDRMLELGADPELVLLHDPENLTTCLTYMKDVVAEIRKTADPEMIHPIVLAIDSVSQLGEKEVNRETGEQEGNDGLGQHARKFSEFFRNTLDFYAHNKAVLITTAQEKESIGGGFGGPEKSHIAKTTIGLAASWNLELVNISSKDVIEDRYIQQCIRLRMAKNKLALKNRSVDIMLYRDENAWDFTLANKHLLFGSYSPFEAGTYGSSGGWYRHDEIGDGKNMHLSEFVNLFYQNEDLVMRCRERLKIRGFGFEFESKFFTLPEPTEEDKNAENA